MPGTDATVKQHPRDEPGTGAVIEQGDGTVRRGDEVAEEARQRKDELQQRGQVRDTLIVHVYPRSYLACTQEELQNQREDTANAIGGAELPEDAGEAKAKKNGFMDKIRSTRDDLLNRVPQEHKDKAGEQKDKLVEQKDKAKQFLSEEYFPEERRDQFIYRGKKVRFLKSGAGVRRRAHG